MLLFFSCFSVLFFFLIFRKAAWRSTQVLRWPLARSSFRLIFGEIILTIITICVTELSHEVDRSYFELALLRHSRPLSHSPSPILYQQISIIINIFFRHVRFCKVQEKSVRLVIRKINKILVTYIQINFVNKNNNGISTPVIIDIL